MNSIGIVRRIDDLGRVVIPKEVLHQIGVKEGDILEIFVDKQNNQVIIKKYGAEGFSIICNQCGSHNVKLNGINDFECLDCGNEYENNWR
jgi:transcriptional pleiotropic regulator of transition state genes